MMESRELRIGNLVECNGEIKEVAVIILDEVGFKVPLKIEAMSIHRFEWNQVKPIPLTEEWLIRMGFEYIEIGEEVYEQTWVINSYVFIWGPCSDKCFYHNFYYGNEVKYVHTLQNLYFALTGEELTITTN